MLHRSIYLWNMAGQRLSPDAWTAAGFRALADHGPSALKAEPLARALGTTKGSFYWHFDDVPAFHSAMLADWEARAITEMTDTLEAHDDPRRALRALGKVAAQGAGSLDPAIRAWAREDEDVAEALARVDAQREGYLRGLCSAMGLSNPEFARMLYATLLGAQELAARDGTDPEPTMAAVVDLILALE